MAVGTQGPFTAKAGYQGTETYAVEVTIYSHRDDVIVGPRPYTLYFSGKSERDVKASVVSLATDKTLGGTAGTFTVELKDPTGTLMDSLVDDDWIDISVNMNGQWFHVLRGIIETFRLNTSTSGKGATTRTVVITGKDFGAIFEKTTVWFNQYGGENLAAMETKEIFRSKNAVNLTVDEVVKSILYGFIGKLTSLRPPRSNWLPPSHIPGAKDTLEEMILFSGANFTDNPHRVSVAPTLMDPQGQGLWALAQEWSDPQVCELFCDLVDVTGNQLAPGVENTLETTRMGIIFRDRPFVTAFGGPTDAQPYFKLPLVELAPQAITQQSVGKGGLERFNAYFASPQAIMQLSATKLDLHGPLWDLADVNRHGMRSMTVDSRYVSNGAGANQLFTMSKTYRQIVMNHHCLNPYLLSGTIALAMLRPDIRVGTRLRVKGRDPSEDVTYYVEQVSHSWRLNAGTTSLGVTRGWKGTDEAHLAVVEGLDQRYVMNLSDGVKAIPPAEL